MNEMSRQIDKVLCRYAGRYYAHQVEDLGCELGFSGARIVRLAGTEGRFCLRGWPEPSLATDRLRGLHRLLAEVARQGVSQVPVPVAALNGDTLVNIDNRNWQLEPWMPGIADFHKNPNTTRLRNAMRCLAAWHQATLQFEPRSHERTWFARWDSAISPAVAERLELIRRWNDSRREKLRRELHSAAVKELQPLGQTILRNYQRASPRIAMELEAARQQRFQLQPCLRDVWHDHILFTGDDVTGWIDAGACRSENVATDLARLLGSLLGDDRNGWDMALKEYQQVRPLTPDERMLVELLDRSNVLPSGMIWLDRLFLQQRSYQQPRQILVRLQDISRRLDDLVQRL